MNKIENNQKITKIMMYPTTIVKCQIGQDWFKNDFEVEFIPNDFYPDYMEVEEYILSNIDGYELNIEDAVDMLYQYLSGYEPKHLKIISHVKGCKTHFNVDVIKE